MNGLGVLSEGKKNDLSIIDPIRRKIRIGTYFLFGCWHALSHALILKMTTKDRSLVDVGCEWLDGMTQRTSEKTKRDEEREVNFL